MLKHVILYLCILKKKSLVLQFGFKALHIPGPAGDGDDSSTMESSTTSESAAMSTVRYTSDDESAEGVVQVVKKHQWLCWVSQSTSGSTVARGVARRP